MNFLVILICLTINYLWLKDFNRFDDTWFFRFRGKVEGITSGAAAKVKMGWGIGILVIYAIPILCITGLLQLTGTNFFGLATMLVHILVLLIAFDRTQPGRIASEFLEKWRAGDMEVCVEYISRELGTSSPPDESDEQALLDYFSKHFTYRCFEKMFVMFFWYMLTGPIGIVFCYVSYQLRDSHSDDQMAEQVNLVALLIQVLEWIPIRLLAITFSLAGNFVHCFENVKRIFWDMDKNTDNAELLHSLAGCALAEILKLDAEEGEGSNSSEESVKAHEVARIEALQGLLERSQAIWLSVFALISIFGL